MGSAMSRGVVACILTLSACLVPPTRSSGQIVGPDLISAEIPSPINNYGGSGGITGYSIGSVGCNIGDQEVSWVGSTSQHPIIGQQLYRLKDGRFEQIGLAWAKHEFVAVAEDYCQLGCIQPTPFDGSQLGVHCSHPSAADLNGKQTRLGPRGQINAFTGVFPYYFTQVPYPPPGFYEIHTGRRLQVHDADLDPGVNLPASYFAEIQYIAADECAAGNGINSISYRQVEVIEQGYGVYNLLPTGGTVQQAPALHAWKTSNDLVQETVIQVPGEGRFILATLASDLGGGIWHYEYALYNQNSDRSGRSFSVPVPPFAAVTNIGFHDVDYHSGDADPYAPGAIRGTDWAATRDNATLAWQSDPWNPQDRQANALRWGTVYNFRFDTNLPPTAGVIELGLYKPGEPASITASTVVPRQMPEECLADEDCADGNPCTIDTCTNTTCTHTPTPGCCVFDSDCDDGLYCNGVETCGSDNRCHDGTAVNCGSHHYCNETNDSCERVVDWGLLALQLEDPTCCLAPGQEVEVQLFVANLEAPINGVQVLIAFDEERLVLQGISRGDGLGSPWGNAVEVYELVSGGRITYALGLIGAGTNADAMVARLSFATSANSFTGPASVEVLTELPPLLTKLTLAANGTAIIPHLGASVATGAIAMKGDMNGDGSQNGADVQGFVDVLVAGASAPVDLCEADLNCDCAVSMDDVPLFVTCLMTGECTCP